jgi:hypothetical protein
MVQVLEKTSHQKSSGCGESAEYYLKNILEVVVYGANHLLFFLPLEKSFLLLKAKTQ